MKAETTGLIQERLLKVLAALSSSQQQEVLDFALFLHQQELANQKELFQQWDAISDDEASVLKAEFAEDDEAIAAAALQNYLTLLQREDEA